MLKPIPGPTQLLIVAGLFVLVPMIFIIYAFIAQYQEIGRAGGTIQIGKYAVRVADHLDRELSLAMNGLETLALSKVLIEQADSPEKVAQFLKESKSDAPGFSQITFYPVGASIPFSTPIVKNALQQAIASGKPTNTPFYRNSTDQHISMIMVYPVLSNGKTLGALVGEVNTRYLLQRIKNRLGFSDILNVFLIGPQGEILENLRKEPLYHLNQLIDDPLRREVTATNSGTFHYTYKKIPYSAGYYASRSIGKLSSPQVTIMISAPELMVEKSKTKPYFFLLFGVLAGIILLIYYGFTLRTSFYKKKG